MSGVGSGIDDAREPSAPQVPVRSADLGLGWAVKESFVQYVRRSRGSRVWVDGGAAATSTDDFYFPLRAAETVGDSVVVFYFAGMVGFAAHMGMLSLRVSSPRVEIELSSGAGILSVEQSDGMRRIAHVRLGQPIVDGAVYMWLGAEVALTAVGAELFEANYAAGERMSPLTLRVPREVFPEGGEFNG